MRIEEFALRYSDSYLYGIEENEMIWTSDPQSALKHPDPLYFEKLQRTAIPDGEVVKVRTEIEVFSSDTWRNGEEDSPIREVCRQTKEFYDTLIDAGFREDIAIKYIACLSEGRKFQLD